MSYRISVLKIIDGRYFSEQYDEMKSIVEAVFTRIPGSVCKRDALLKWCGERLSNYVSNSIVFF